MSINLVNADCLDYMSTMSDNSVNMTLTDIPYGGVNRKSNGLRNLNKENADVVGFSLVNDQPTNQPTNQSLLPELLRVTKGTIIIFCGFSQLSTIYDFFDKQKGTTRILVWQKSNPSPMNGQYIYESGIELAVWFKPRGKGNATFNAHCKNTVFKYPNGTRKIHPTQKNAKLFMELLEDNSAVGDLVFDPFAGSATTGVACQILQRNFLGIELDSNYYELAKKRLEE